MIAYYSSLIKNSFSQRDFRAIMKRADNETKDFRLRDFTDILIKLIELLLLFQLLLVKAGYRARKLQASFRLAQPCLHFDFYNVID